MVYSDDVVIMMVATSIMYWHVIKEEPCKDSNLPAPAIVSQNSISTYCLYTSYCVLTIKL